MSQLPAKQSCTATKLSGFDIRINFAISARLSFEGREVQGTTGKRPLDSNFLTKAQNMFKCKLAVFSSLPTPKSVVGLHRDQLPLSVKGNLWTETPPDKINY